MTRMPWNMARVTGLEPATSGVTGRRSNQLSYTRASLGEPPTRPAGGGCQPGWEGEFSATPNALTECPKTLAGRPKTW